MTSAATPLQIDIVSDVMCPWCILGYKQLAAALEATGTPHDIRWHPFELNPTMPREGQTVREHLAEKYGTTDEQSQANRARLTQLGDELGFSFRYSSDMRMHNTFDTHQLLHWADQQGRKHDLKMAMFTAHFTHERDLSDRTVLADVAAELGLDRTEALAVLEDQRFADAVRGAEGHWSEMGIRSVPSVIFNQRHLVSGAQGVDSFTHVLKQLAAMPLEAAPSS